MCSRKYRQKGYMEDAGGEKRKRGRPQRENIGRPRGRGLGAPTATVFRCARCGGKQNLSASLTTAATCLACGKDLHTCTNCLHFDTGSPNECREAVPLRIAKKATRNECGLFAPKLVQEFEADSGKPNDPKAAFDSLFDF